MGVGHKKDWECTKSFSSDEKEKHLTGKKKAAMNFTISKSIRDVNTVEALRSVEDKRQCQQMNAWMQAVNK